MIKAIIIGETGAYAHMNGQTVEVESKNFYNDLSVDRIVLAWDENGEKVSVDFKLKNALFVDVADVAQKIYDAKNWGTTNANGAWYGLREWAGIHGVKLTPQYNCPT